MKNKNFSFLEESVYNRLREVAVICYAFTRKMIS
ncbi:MAG: hypothetical protein UY72_C0011G0004 [Candidatus Uhrbacteria bacterium GW2011_GWD2_52_7]|uniref:Uncharacterized protein n=1 Tax=Candidatus Uhrbacteria bacterium GW2011_GWD2_52_7 TaxID=1618989 RepID=A0A0G1ZQH5_9BACT|nr:MAG: hypothetical protein UY72_C0011G0004 [Candidatus Uhrbacteria bacterium GW2011_GWD2_52_7]